MQKINIAVILSILTFMTSCEFNQSINKDLKTGAYSRGDGISCDNISIELNGIEENRNEFVFGETVNLKFNNVQGLKRLNGKTYPDLSMFIVKNELDTVLSKPNLLKQLENGTEINPLQLKANFIAALPYQNKEQYAVHISIRDLKDDGNFSYKLPFTISESDILKITKNGIEYTHIYLWNETLKEPVLNKNLNSNHQYALILDGIEGLIEEENMVFPIFAIDIQDQNKKSILSSPNILKYDEHGLNSENVNEQLIATIRFPQKQIDYPCTLIAKIKDQKSSSIIEITAELNIE